MLEHVGRILTVLGRYWILHVICPPRTISPEGPLFMGNSAALNPAIAARFSRGMLWHPIPPGAVMADDLDLNRAERQVIRRVFMSRFGEALSVKEGFQIWLEAPAASCRRIKPLATQHIYWPYRFRSGFWLPLKHAMVATD